MRMNAWMMEAEFWEKKYFLPEHLARLESKTESEKVWGLKMLWKFESSERFREIWKRKGFNGEEESLFIEIS